MNTETNEQFLLKLASLDSAGLVKISRISYFHSD